ncbi:hypothetical protein IFM89_005846 [Coptis chinensis]|uniref:Uncharacterized protein n=1 Tax=Coptis chinensis TaxID=261450 RepID=A0A835HGM5_9MAGN|nr:hypothetical protein IFM89_005846 [Coptis chinensis]
MHSIAIILTVTEDYTWEVNWKAFVEQDHWLENGNVVATQDVNQSQNDWPKILFDGAFSMSNSRGAAGALCAQVKMARF